MMTFQINLVAKAPPPPPPVVRIVKAISVRQPWAWLLLYGKDVENRSKRTSYRGPIYIHASKTFDWKGYDWLCDKMPEIITKSVVEHFGITPGRGDLKVTNGEFGGIIGATNLTDCVESSASPWFMGPYGYVMEKPVAMPFYPCKGQLGIFNLELKGV